MKGEGIKEFCFKTITKWSVIEPFKRLAHIFDTEIQKIIEQKISEFMKHCKAKKAQRKCSACVVLGDLKNELFNPTQRA